MYRIYFDPNAGDESDRFDLGIPGSLRDIELIGSELKNGMRVILYDNEELEVEPLIEFDPRYQCWMATPIWTTLKHLGE
jgi:hypothetical protein